MGRSPPAEVGGAVYGGVRLSISDWDNRAVGAASLPRFVPHIPEFSSEFERVGAGLSRLEAAPTALLPDWDDPLTKIFAK